MKTERTADSYWFSAPGRHESDIAYTYPSGGAMVIFIYEETTMKRDPPPQLDKPP